MAAPHRHIWKLAQSKGKRPVAIHNSEQRPSKPDDNAIMPRGAAKRLGAHAIPFFFFLHQHRLTDSILFH